MWRGLKVQIWPFIIAEFRKDLDRSRFIHLFSRSMCLRHGTCFKIWNVEIKNLQGSETLEVYEEQRFIEPQIWTERIADIPAHKQT